MNQPVYQPVQSEAEIRRCAALANAIWHECYRQTLSAGQIDYMVEKFQSAPAITEQIGKQGYRYFLVLAGGKAVGYFAVQPENGKLLLSKIYLEAEARGRFTAEMMAYIDTLAAEMSCKTLWLTVNRHNLRAQKAYHKYGFSQVRTQQVDIGGGYVMDDYVFEKKISRDTP